MDEPAQGGQASSDSFYQSFRLEATDIEENISLLKTATEGERNNAINHIQESITQLSDKVREASSYIPAHDRRIYSDAIQGLQNKLRQTQQAVAPKKKFAFKAGPKLGSRTTANSEKATELSASTADTSESSDTHVTTQSAQLPVRQDASTKLHGRENEYLTLPPQPNGEIRSSTISNITRCIVNMRTPTSPGQSLATLTLKAISKSLIICSQVDGPIHLTNIAHSVVVAASRQFRMHESHSCDIYLHTSSRPIIEHCSGIRFAPLPASYELKGRGGDGRGLWQQVDDFNWHRSEPSPNWKLLEERERVSDEFWRSIESSQGKEDVGSILQEVGIST